MVSTALLTAQQVGILFIIIAAGIIARLTHIISEKGISDLTNILFYIITPAVVINSLASSSGAEAVGRLWQSALGAVTAFALLICVSTLIFIIFKRHTDKKGIDKKDINALKYAAVFSNLGYMGIPLVRALGGEVAVSCVSVGIIVFSVVNFTYGISLFNNGRNKIISIILNPGTIGFIIGLPLMLFSVKLPEIIAQPIYLLSQSQTVVAMLLCGTILGGIKLSDFFRDKLMWVAVFLRLIFMAALTTALFMLLPFQPVVKLSLGLTFACPCAVAGPMFSAKFNGSTELLSKSVALSTFFSVITLPIVAGLLSI